MFNEYLHFGSVNSGSTAGVPYHRHALDNQLCRVEGSPRINHQFTIVPTNYCLVAFAVIVPGESDLVNYRVIIAASSTLEQFACRPQKYVYALRRSSAPTCFAFRFQANICVHEMRLKEYRSVVCVAVDVRTLVASAIMLTSSLWHLCSRQTPACKR